jgi:hypothetical protein
MLRLCCLAACLCLTCGGGDSGTGVVEGSARLPNCNEAPAAQLDGTVWYDTGQLTIKTSGCSLDKGTSVEVCPLNWEISQQGNDLTIEVDNEYTMRGRLCGDQLHLAGGWWLPLPDDSGECSYRDEDGTEVGIESEGQTLTVSDSQMTGTLVLRERCLAEYEVTVHLLYNSDE